MKLIAFVLLAALAPMAYAASTSDADLPDEVRALLMKEKAKGTLRANAHDKDNDDSGGNGKGGGRKSGGGAQNGCNMDIGNVTSGTGSGSGRNVTTIVTGPVIQMNNKCK